MKKYIYIYISYVLLKINSLIEKVNLLFEIFNKLYSIIKNTTLGKDFFYMRKRWSKYCSVLHEKKILTNLAI